MMGTLAKLLSTYPGKRRRRRVVFAQLYEVDKSTDRVDHLSPGKGRRGIPRGAASSPLSTNAIVCSAVRELPQANGFSVGFMNPGAERGLFPWRRQGSTVASLSIPNPMGDFAKKLPQLVKQTRVELSIGYSLQGMLAQIARAGPVRDLAARLTADFARNMERQLSGAADHGPAQQAKSIDGTAFLGLSFAAVVLRENFKSGGIKLCHQAELLYTRNPTGGAGGPRGGSAAVAGRGHSRRRGDGALDQAYHARHKAA